MVTVSWAAERRVTTETAQLRPVATLTDSGFLLHVHLRSSPLPTADCATYNLFCVNELSTCSGCVSRVSPALLHVQGDRGCAAGLRLSRKRHETAVGTSSVRGGQLQNSASCFARLLFVSSKCLGDDPGSLVLKARASFSCSLPLQ